MEESRSGIPPTYKGPQTVENRNCERIELNAAKPSSMYIWKLNEQRSDDNKTGF